MKGGKGSSFSKDELTKLLQELGFMVEYANGKGKQSGKGDHIVYVHEEYRDIKIVIPNARKDLKENLMSTICSNLVIIMDITGTDTSTFIRKEGVEGKILKTLKKAKNNICSLFSTTLRNRLGLRNDDEVLAYIEEQKKSIQEAREQDFLISG